VVVEHLYSYRVDEKTTAHVYKFAPHSEVKQEGNT
jgi:hypothetical protein